VKIYFNPKEEEHLKKDMTEGVFPFTKLIKEDHAFSKVFLYATSDMITGSDLQYIQKFNIEKIVE